MDIFVERSARTKCIALGHASASKCRWLAKVGTDKTQDFVVRKLRKLSSPQIFGDAKVLFGPSIASIFLGHVAFVKNFQASLSFHQFTRRNFEKVVDFRVKSLSSKDSGM